MKGVGCSDPYAHRKFVTHLARGRKGRCVSEALSLVEHRPSDDFLS